MSFDRIMAPRTLGRLSHSQGLIVSERSDADGVTPHGYIQEVAGEAQI